MLGCEAATAAVAIEESVRTGLPVWVALSCVAEESPGEGAPGCKLNTNLDDLRNGAPTFADSAADFAQLGGDVYFAFHTQVDVMREALRLLREAVDVPVGVYPHCGGSASDGQTNGTVSPSDFLEEGEDVGSRRRSDHRRLLRHRPRSHQAAQGRPGGLALDGGEMNRAIERHALPMLPFR